MESFRNPEFFLTVAQLGKPATILWGFDDGILGKMMGKLPWDGGSLIINPISRWWFQIFFIFTPI